MKYVYYNPITGQVEAEFDTPKLSEQANWVAKGLSQAVVPVGMVVDRDYKITELHVEEIPPVDEETLSVGDMTVIDIVVPSVNPIQKLAKLPTKLDDLYGKLAAETITADEIVEMLRLER